jgi:hypothetical protein
MVSTSGSRLLPTEAVRVLREQLLPHTTILTPNVPEALLLLSDAGLPTEGPQNVNDLITIAKAVQSLGPKFVLLKGGHLPLKKGGDVAKTALERALMVDILYGEGVVTKMETAYQNSKNTHGTGCSLACELTVYLYGNVYSDSFSCHSIEPRKWSQCHSGSEVCLQVRGGRYQNFDRPRPWKRPHQSFPLDLHFAFCPVSKAQCGYLLTAL